VNQLSAGSLLEAVERLFEETNVRGIRWVFESYRLLAIDGLRKIVV
jgi:hypothetical protein